MANIVINGDFQRGLEMWDVSPAYYRDAENPLVRASTRTGSSRGSSLYIELGRHLLISQALPLSAFATGGSLRFSIGGYGADFYVIITYEGGERESTHFFGHWEDSSEPAWEELTVPVSSTRAIDSIAFNFFTAHDIYLDDISLDGFVSATPERRVREIPEEIYPLPQRFHRMEHRLIAMERELKRITALLAKRESPDIAKQVEVKLQKRIPKNRATPKKA